MMDGRCFLTSVIFKSNRLSSRILDDLGGEDEFWDGGEVEGLAVEDLVELVADAIEGFGMRAEEIEEPGERVRGSLVAGY